MQPGRSCPLHYRYAPQNFARAADFEADTLYVIGGLYGNVPALDAVLQLAALEAGPVTLAFNGDFNWFNRDDAGFERINHEVLRHHALRGNVETELANDDDSAGCGCAYPASVSDAEGERSNHILTLLRETARRHAALRTRLAQLPMNLVARVGGERVAIVHGDLESLAGWSLAQDALTSNQKTIINQIVTSNCRIIASSHTCLPLALSLDTRLGRCAVFNNGAAGMPNFHRTHCGVMTRVAATPAPASQATLYGTRIGNVFVDALPVSYDHARWQHEFLANWPAGSAAHASYFQRILQGPAYTQQAAERLTVSFEPTARPTAIA